MHFWIARSLQIKAGQGLVKRINVHYWTMKQIEMNAFFTIKKNIHTTVYWMNIIINWGKRLRSHCRSVVRSSFLRRRMRKFYKNRTWVWMNTNQNADATKKANKEQSNHDGWHKEDVLLVAFGWRSVRRILERSDPLTCAALVEDRLCHCNDSCEDLS